MGETPGVIGATIGQMRRQLQGLIDADLILPEDGQWLMATLDRTVQGLTAAEIPASRSDVQGLLDRLQSLTEAGVLESATGHPPVEIARLILTSLRGEAEGAASANSQSLGTLQPHSAQRPTPKKGTPR